MITALLIILLIIVILVVTGLVIMAFGSLMALWPIAGTVLLLVVTDVLVIRSIIKAIRKKREDKSASK